MTVTIRQVEARSSWCCRQDGYTLVETMVVLTIMTVLFAISLPMMRKPLAKSELVSAAQEVQAAMAEARLASIESGVETQFQYRIATGEHRVVDGIRRPGNAEIDAAEDRSVGQSPDDSASYGEPAPRHDTHQPLSNPPAYRPATAAPVIDDSVERLSAKIRFLSGQMLEARRATANQSESASSRVEEDVPLELSNNAVTLTDEGTSANGAEQQLPWQRIRFFPDGSCETADVILADEIYTLRIKLRGLTGGIAVGRPQLIRVVITQADASGLIPRSTVGQQSGTP